MDQAEQMEQAAWGSFIFRNGWDALHAASREAIALAERGEGSEAIVAPLRAALEACRNIPAREGVVAR